jgi:hypothetical protein
MNLRQLTSMWVRGTVSAAVAAAWIITSAGALAQAPPPPPPAGPPGAVTPPPPPPPGPVAAPAAAAAPAIDPMKEREIIDSIVSGKGSLKTLDLATAQMYFEQAFAKCDEYQVKGPLLARVYMALGALYAGFLQQIPQGTEFMKMALQASPAVSPEAELTNDTVQATFNMVRERLGITGPAMIDQGVGGPMAPGGFWVMKHDRVTQSKRMFPFGIFIESNPMVAIQGVRLYFRLPSDRTYQAADMQKNGAFFGMLIGCDAIALLDPEAIYYYIEIIGGDGSVIAREGDVNSPIEIKMVEEAAFQGVHPNLPGLKDPEKCNPDDAAPCPPWDPHCHDIPCVTTEDCVGSKVCREGYCVEGSGVEGSDEEREPIGALGLSITLGIGMGFGVVGGKDTCVCENGGGCLARDDEWTSELAREHGDHDISLASGLSPSWMFERLELGYFLTDWLRAGLFMRLQNINSNQMKIAGPANGDDNLKNFPMWGLTGSVFYWGNGKWFADGQVVTEDGKLADKQGLRLYARLEVDFYGAMYHEITVTYTPFDDDEKVEKKQQRASGMQAIGIGPGLLYGIHKYVDVGIEVMYDYVGLGTETWAHNFDVWAQLHLHF